VLKSVDKISIFADQATQAVTYTQGLQCIALYYGKNKIHRNAILRGQKMKPFCHIHTYSKC